MEPFIVDNDVHVEALLPMQDPHIWTESTT